MRPTGGSRAKAGKYRAGDGAGAPCCTVAKHEELLQPLDKEHVANTVCESLLQHTHMNGYEINVVFPGEFQEAKLSRVVARPILAGDVKERGR